MDFEFIYCGQRSFSIELINENPFFSPKKYSVFVNEKLIEENVDKNIFSVYDLEPSTKYSVKVLYDGIEKVKEFITRDEFVTLNVKKFGAKGDGVSDDTSFIQACILACPKNGRVLFPQGTYYTRPLFLKSDITIELKEGAILLGNTDRNNYPILPGTTLLTDESDDYNLGSWEGNPLDCFASIITSVNVKNVNIIGKGVIDGNANNSDWWKDVRTKRIAWRPRGMFLVRSENITVEGITIKNTPSWNLHPYFSQNIRFIDMKVENPSDSPNTDGCDPESCKNIDILGVNFSVGDDCIAIKSGKIYMGKKYKKPSENFNIRNCSMNFGHGAVVLGSEMAGGIKNINVEKCFFNHTDRGLRIKTRRGRGKDAIIDGITFKNIKMDDVLTPLVINMFYYCDPDGKTEYVWSKEKLPVDDRTPYLGKFKFKDIECKNVNVCAGAFYGLPEQPIEEIVIENVRFNYSKDPKEGIPAMMTGLEPMKNRGLIFNNVNNVIIDNVHLDNNLLKEVETLNVNKIVRR
jgi:polygalacturonase